MHPLHLQDRMDPSNLKDPKVRLHQWHRFHQHRWGQRGRMDLLHRWGLVDQRGRMDPSNLMDQRVRLHQWHRLHQHQWGQKAR
jgi:hypothetical protein